MPTSVASSALIALCFNSFPTCGPTTSSCTTCAPASTFLRALSRRERASPAASFASGGRRTTVSREEPKLCTSGSWKPAAVSCVRTASTSTACVKLTSAFTPPVKSMARFRPRVKNDTSETRTSTVESAYHSLRVAMKWKLVWWLKNSTDNPYEALTDCQLAELATPTVNECQKRPASHEGGEHRGQDAQDQHHGKALDRAGTEHP